jgi:hypothetical protein
MREHWAIKHYIEGEEKQETVYSSTIEETVEG